MRKIATVASILMILAVPLAFAGQTAAKDQSKTHEMSAVLVSMDLNQHQVTIKSDGGEEMTLPVKGEAVSTLASGKVKPGDKVVATCENDGQGHPQAITKIRSAAA